MAHEIVMPRVDMDMTTGRMGAWRAVEGARVVKGETLFEIETDKAAMEVDAPASGVLRFVAASEGDVLPVGACIGWIVAEGEHFVPPAPSAAAAPPAAHASRRQDAGQKDEARAGAATGLRATPAARRAARERGLSLSAVRGSGPNGRIQKRDLPERVAAAPRIASVNREWLRRGEGAPLVLIHGLCADLNGWRPLFRVLPETRPALAIDLPGHGLSPLGEDASFEALVEAARSVLVEEGATRAHLVGHSLGGAVAAALSQAPGVTALSLMLIAPAGLGEETNSAFFDGYLQADDEASLTPWLNLLVSDPASLGAAMAAATLRQRAERPVVAAQRRLVETLLANRKQAIDIRGWLAAPEAPVKVVFGLEDRITPAHHAEDLSPLIALHRFPQIGHMPHFEARREVARLIEELARAGSGGPRSARTAAVIKP
jgi:pimeloyl-ACP methyl ester carboxylesterase